MKKTLLLCGLALGLVGASYGQSTLGTVIFNNDNSSLVRFAPGVNGGTNVGSAFTVGLYGGPSGTAESALQLAGTTTILASLPGRFVGQTVSVPGVAGGASATLQVRAWTGAATYAAATSRGQSALWTQVTGNATATDPAKGITVAAGGGFAGFANVTAGSPVPEPSTIALGLLGLGALALFRRRK